MRQEGHPVATSDARVYFFLGAVIVGLAAGDLVYSAYGRPSSLLVFPLWLLVPLAGLFGYQAVREKDVSRRSAWALGAVYLVASRILPEWTDGSRSVVLCCLLLVAQGALFVFSAWPQVATLTRYGGAAVVVLAVGIRVFILQGDSAVSRHAAPPEPRNLLARRCDLGRRAPQNNRMQRTAQQHWQRGGWRRR